jgi:hypothetical protein
LLLGTLGDKLLGRRPLDAQSVGGEAFAEHGQGLLVDDAELELNAIVLKVDEGCERDQAKVLVGELPLDLLQLGESVVGLDDGDEDAAAVELGDGISMLSPIAGEGYSYAVEALVQPDAGKALGEALAVALQDACHLGPALLERGTLGLRDHAAGRLWPRGATPDGRSSGFGWWRWWGRYDGGRRRVLCGRAAAARGEQRDDRSERGEGA